MYTVSVNSTSPIDIDKKDGEWLIDGKPFNLDLLELENGRYHLIHENKSYNIVLSSVNFEEKTVDLTINGKTYTNKIQEPLDLLLKKMGLDASTTKKIDSLKAPMPGLVVSLRVEEGQEFKKGDPIIVLEAMKMENILKAASDGIVKKILVQKGQAIEKNEVLVQFQ